LGLLPQGLGLPPEPLELLLVAVELLLDVAYLLLDPRTLTALHAELNLARGSMAKKKTAAKAKSKQAKNGKLSSQKLVTTTQLAAVLGVTISKPLTSDQIRRLVKPFPGYIGLLDDVATQLDDDAALLGLKGITGASLLTLQGQQKFLSQRESVSQMVYESVYQQRQQVDSEAMSALFQINKRVEAMKAGVPDLAARWSFLSAFLAKFRPGTNAAKVAQAANRADEKAARASVQAAKKKRASQPPPPAPAS
jgi:hypothetical protein